MGTTGTPSSDPLTALRDYRRLAPWSLRDMATLAGAILQASGIRPLNAVASVRPSERTIRFYVARGLVTPPNGRGTAATYGYRHMMQVLHIKLRQMEGLTLDAIVEELSDMTGDVLERRVASALGPSLPTPDQLCLSGEDAPTWGRAGRALRAWLSEKSLMEDDIGEEGGRATTWRRIAISRGVELHVQEGHPLAELRDRDAEVADAVRLTVTRMLGASFDRTGPRQEASESDVSSTSTD